jgi:2-haloacid dehalogenase
MTNAPPRTAPRAVLFDAYGTLFDVHSVALKAEQLFPGHGDALSRLWRERQIEYSRLSSMAGRYQPFWQLTGLALQQAAALLRLDLSAGAHTQLLNEYRHLASFPENRAVLEALRARGVPTGILSNGDPAMLDVAVKSAGFSDLLDHLLSVDPLQRYKPDPAVYALGPSATGVPASETLFVSSNGWDAIGAAWFGYRTLWVNRAGLPLDPLGIAPERVGANLRDVLAFFD